MVVPVRGEVVAVRLDSDELVNFGVIRQRGEVLRIKRVISSGLALPLQLGPLELRDSGGGAFAVVLTRRSDREVELEFTLDTSLLERGYFRTAVRVDATAGDRTTKVSVPAQAFMIVEQ